MPSPAFQILSLQEESRSLHHFPCRVHNTIIVRREMDIGSLRIAIAWAKSLRVFFLLMTVACLQLQGVIDLPYRVQLQ